MKSGAENAEISLDGPYSAIIIQGDSDEPGECVSVHEKLAQAGVDVKESSGIADIKESYGIILYLTREDTEKAVKALKR